MIRKSLYLSILGIWVMLISVASIVAQDICVEEAFANSAMPTTIAEARQLLQDLREVLAECDPPSEGAIELDVLRELSVDGMYEDEYGCYVGVSYGTRSSRPDIYVIVVGDGNANYLLELKRPGSQKWRQASDINLRTFVDNPDTGYYIHEWDGYNWPKGRYESSLRSVCGGESKLPLRLTPNTTHAIELILLATRIDTVVDFDDEVEQIGGATHRVAPTFCIGFDVAEMAG